MPPLSIKDERLFAFQGEKLLVRLTPEVELPGIFDLPHEEQNGSLLDRLSKQKSVPRGWVMLDKEFQAPDGLDLVPLREVWGLLGEEIFVEAGRALQLMGWHRENTFCCRCGNRMADHETETARSCPTCGFTVYPTISPAIIVAIEREGKLLLARSPHFPKGRYSVLAGFVEPGETLEQAVQREVFEEVSVRVGDIRYFGSQPWPFPHSLMVGFTACWESGEISVDPKEIEEAAWFAPEEFPGMPPSISISRRLIDDFLHRHGVKA